MRTSHAAFAIPILLLAPTAYAQAVDPRADVAIYGDHRPTDFATGGTFQSPFSYVEDSNDPTTVLEFEAVPGIKNELGTIQWGDNAFGKYLLVGNYKSFLQTPIEDERLGIFDSESKAFCFIDIQPLTPGKIGGTARTLIVASPTARQSRIFFAGNGSDSGASLGYIAGDLDNASPCSWQVHLISPSDMNQSSPPAKQPCPGGGCEFDGIGLLAHTDVQGDPYGSDLIVAGDYFSERIAILQIDSSGVTPLDTYDMPNWVLASAQGGMCYSANPVGLPSIDAQRPATDRRFTAAFDSFPLTLHDAAARAYGQLILTPDAAYKVGLAPGLLPGEGRACSLCPSGNVG